MPLPSFDIQVQLAEADNTLEATTVTWNPNPQAVYYSVKLGDDTYQTDDTNYTFTGLGVKPAMR